MAETNNQERVFEAEASFQADMIFDNAALSVTAPGPDGTERVLIEPSLTETEVNLEGLHEEMTAGMIALASYAYLLGRLDQINDTAGNNRKRAVRAQELPSVIDQSLGMEALNWDRADLLDLFDRFRNAFVVTE